MEQPANGKRPGPSGFMRIAHRFQAFVSGKSGQPPQVTQENQQKLIDLCTLPEQAFLEKIGTRLTGLTTAESEERLSEWGTNQLAAAKQRGFLAEIFDRMKNPLVIQLLVICIVCFIMQDYRSTIVVGGMIFLSVFLAYFQERRSSEAAKELQKLIRTSSIVIRNGQEKQVETSVLVPGDLVLLSVGSIIPADIRIISAKDFFVSQSALTGESMPVEKFAKVDPEKKSALELDNSCFQGSTVVSGSARAIVINTGMRTFLGGISQQITVSKETTAFDKGVSSFVWLMVRFMVIMVSVTFLIVGITKHNWLEALLFALSVAVGLTPEMLPMIMTVCLSKGAMTMSRKKVIVKKLKAIQNLGSMNVFCTDKTGTLTQDRVVLQKWVDVTNRESVDVLRYAYMNSYYQTGLRNLLDKAILSHEDLDVERNSTKVDEIPFDFMRKRMSVIIDYEETHVLICKGAVEDVYNACGKYQIDDDIYPLIDVVRNDLMDDYRELSAQGYRVLAVAYNEFPRTKEVFSADDEKDLILLGYIAFYDPPKDSAAGAIAAMNQSGISVKILTGDNELVTKKICTEVGLKSEGLVTGPQLAAMSPEEFSKTVNISTIFARLSPSQKENIIFTLRDQGNIVGFMGDGINDAPAMKAADVAISVDTAVDVAKESADIILLERSLAVLEDGIVEGRKVFANITKYIRMGASSNFGNMFSVVGGSAFLPFLPMAPIQVLVNNLLYDFSQTGIPTDNVDPEQASKPRKWNVASIQRFMVFIGPISSIFDYATFFLMLFYFGCRHFSDPGISAVMKTHYEMLFHTGWFTESILTQTLIVHIIRTNRIPFFQSRSSPLLAFSTLLIMAVAVVLPYSPVASFIGLVPLPFTFWIFIAGFLLTYSILTHLVKRWFDHKFGDA